MARTMLNVQDIVRRAARELTGGDGATERIPTDEEVEFLQALTDIASVALENTRRYSELEDTLEERTRALADARRELEEHRRAEEALSRAEAELRQAQKMEALGRLAGGVAHDFNNLLSVVLSYSSMLLSDLDPDDPRRAEVEQIQLAGERGARLTQRLLSLSRQKVVAPKELDLSEVVRELEPMLRGLVGEDIQFELRLSPSCTLALLDQGHMEQLLTNLVVNARDAMPRGGRITIETARAELDAEVLEARPGIERGKYARLSVSDTGIGMDEELRSHVFEPFFTTKEKSKGSGLGLSTVYAIVRQSAGHIWVDSEPGQGTTFTLTFPLTTEGASVPPEPGITVGTLTGSETVLLVEDDDAVRVAARGILCRHGYQVLVARDPGEALLLCERFQGTIHLLITDIVMPVMSGAQLAQRLVTARPEMKVLCMSGYTDETVIDHGLVDARFPFLQKPITPQSLLTRARQILET